MPDISSTLIDRRRRIIPLRPVYRIFTIRRIGRVRVRRQFQPETITIITSLLPLLLLRWRRTTVVCLRLSRFRPNSTRFFDIRAERRIEKTNIRGRWPRSCRVSGRRSRNSENEFVFQKNRCLTPTAERLSSAVPVPRRNVGERDDVSRLFVSSSRSRTFAHADGKQNESTGRFGQDQ